MNPSLQVLVVEDSENDTLLLELELQRAGYEPQCRRVETGEAMRAALLEQPWDLVIADYVMPHFNGLAALSLVKELGLDLPFIVVSGHITDATAVAAMRAGAHDYVMKDNLSRLGSAVDRELREAEVRRERRRTEAQRKQAELRLAAEHAVTRILANAAAVEEAAPRIVQELVRAVEVDMSGLWLVDPAGQRLELCASALRVPDLGRQQTFLDGSRAFSFPPGSGLPGQVWESRQAQWWPELAASPQCQRLELAAQAGLCSAVAFPIQTAVGCFGVLEFFTVRRLEPEPTLNNMMTAIASEIGQFIQRRRAEEALRRAHDELELRVQQRTADLKQANAKLQTAIAERQRLEHELLEITEKERRRIGLDLHDDLGQKLSGIALMTKGLELRLDKLQSDAAQDAARIHTLITQAMNHASDLAHDLVTLDLKEGDLPAALAGLAAHVHDLFQITCRFKAEGDIPPLEPNAVGQLYKIAQEAVTNAIKHGQAKRVELHLAHEAGQVCLTIRNNGLPFPDLHSPTTGMGLRIMNYRANLIGATLDIKAAGTRGTLVTCRLPLGAPAENGKR